MLHPPKANSLHSNQNIHFCLIDSRVLLWEQRGQVSMETVVLRQWESITRQYTIVNKVDNENWPL